MVAFFPSNPNVSAAVQGYNGNLTAVDVANIQAQQAQAQAQQNAQNQAQERFFRNQQAQEQNAIARQQMANEDFFRRGQLSNSSEHDKAVMAAAAAQNGMLVDQANKDRASRETIAGMAHPSVDWRDQQLMAQQNEIVDGANNYAAALNQKDLLDAAQVQMNKAETAEQQRSPVKDALKRVFIPGVGPALAGINYFNNNDAAKSNVLAQIPTAVGGRPFFAPNPGMDNTANIKTAKDSLLQQTSALSKMLEAGSRAGLDAHVTRGPDGKWMATVKPLTMGGTNTTTGTFFNPGVAAPVIPSVTNAPASVPPVTANRFIFDPSVGQAMPVQ